MLDKIKGCLFYKKNELKEIKESVVEMKESVKKIHESIVDIDPNTEENIKYAKYIKNEIMTKKVFFSNCKNTLLL